MRPTITFLQKRFDRFNRLCFGGCLPTPCLRLTTARTFGGRLSYTVRNRPFHTRRFSSPVISISTLRDFSESEYEDILLHEMIHLYILAKNIKDTSPHGEKFRAMMDQINSQYGRHITVSLRVTEKTGSQDTRLRRHLICVSQLRSGHTGITLSAQTCIFRLWREIGSLPQVEKTAWYVSADPYFNRFPHSHTLKIYKAEPEELAAHLATAQRLYNDGKEISTDAKDRPL